MKLVDPIKLLVEKASTSTNHPQVVLANELTSDVPFEIPLEPPAGARLQRLTIASTYRTPIPVLFHPESKTTYPIQNKG